MQCSLLTALRFVCVTTAAISNNYLQVDLHEEVLDDTPVALGASFG
jgi:hypothetical protein